MLEKKTLMNSLTLISAEGEWVKLFKKSNDYIQTKLFRYVNNHTFFITIDYWNNKKSRDYFFKKHKIEFEAIDKRCEELTVKEELIGEYSLVK